MPRMSIYITDDLKAQMDVSGDGMNWSAIAQRAFLEAVQPGVQRDDRFRATLTIKGTSDPFTKAACHRWIKRFRDKPVWVLLPGSDLAFVGSVTDSDVAEIPSDDPASQGEQPL